MSNFEGNGIPFKFRIKSGRRVLSKDKPKKETIHED